MDSFEAKMFIGDYAPKQIWIDEHSEWWPTHSRSDTTPYIRADLVDGLVDLLVEWQNVTSANKDWDDYEMRIEFALAALAKLEDV
jgi:hypothetical protein